MSRHPATLAIDLYRGDDATFLFSLWADDDHLIPIPLDGVTAKAEVHSGLAVMPFVATVELPNVIRLVLPADSWETFTAEMGNWDLQLTLPAGNIYTAIKGMVRISGDIVQ